MLYRLSYPGSDAAACSACTSRYPRAALLPAPPACPPHYSPHPHGHPPAGLVNATLIAQRGIQIHQHGLILHLILTVGAAWAVGQGGALQKGGCPAEEGPPLWAVGVFFPPLPRNKAQYAARRAALEKPGVFQRGLGKM